MWKKWRGLNTFQIHCNASSGGTAVNLLSPNRAIFCIPPLRCHNTTDWLKHIKERNSTNYLNKAHLLIEMHSSWQPHEPGWENAKSVQSCQGNGWLLLSIYNKKIYITFFETTWFQMCYFIVVMSSLLFYNVENKKNHWMSSCVQTFDWYCV